MPAPMIADELTTSQAAALAAVSAQTIVQWANSGRLPCRMTPLGRLFDRTDVERLAAARELGPARGRVRTHQLR